MRESVLKKIKVPHTYVLLFLLVVVMAILTWFIPSGSFKTVEKEVSPGLTKNVIISGTYQTTSKVTEDGTDIRQGIFDVLKAPAEGVQAAAQVVAFIFILGGAFAIITKTGAISSGLASVANIVKGKESLIIPVMMLVISVGGSVIGTSEETLPFYMLFYPLLISFGYDSITTVMMILLSSQIGYTGSTLNPFNVLVAQGLVGIQGNPQLWLRCIEYVVYIAIAMTFVMLYARKVKKDPKKSLMYESDLRNKEYFISSQNDVDNIKFTARHKIILIGLGAGIVWMVWGLLKKGYYMDEIAAIFLAVGIFAGIVGKLSLNDMGEAFVFGLKDFAYAAIVIGMANAILVIAQNGQIIDTILNYLANGLKSVPVAGFTTVMLLVQNVIAFFVPSSSGQAALTMPIMGPLAELLKINKEAIVTTYQAGNGITNIISPTNGILMAALGLGRISLGKWVKSVIKLVIIIELAAMVFCAISAFV
jgi:uncharacterized ion transporter superfamily protein YfcC